MTNSYRYKNTPNFPLNLDVHPSTQALVTDSRERMPPSGLDANSGSKAQEQAVWKRRASVPVVLPAEVER